MCSAILQKTVCCDIYSLLMPVPIRAVPQPTAWTAHHLTYSVRLVEFCTYSKLNSVIHLVL
jgi:hypothetical protein